MKVDIDGDDARLTVEKYADLLTIRALPEYGFVDADTAVTSVKHLADIGYADPTAPASSAPGAVRLPGVVR